MRSLDRVVQLPDGAIEFYSRFPQALIKAEEANGKWWVYLEVSNESEDQQGDRALRKAFEEQRDFYLSHGNISWDHQHKFTHDPKFIIGEPTDVAFGVNNETLVKGFLYQENDLAKGLFQNLLSQSSRFGASAGGYILQKSQNGAISKIYWDETAITYKPVNDLTLGKVSIVPYAEFMKAMMAGSGVDASAFTGGRALSNESLQGATSPISQETLHGSMLRNFLENGSINKVIKTPDEAVGLFNDIWIAIQLNQVKSYNDVIAFMAMRGYSAECAVEVAMFLAANLPTIVEKIQDGGK